MDHKKAQKKTKRDKMKSKRRMTILKPDQKKPAKRGNVTRTERRNGSAVKRRSLRNRMRKSNKCGAQAYASSLWSAAGMKQGSISHHQKCLKRTNIRIVVSKRRMKD